MFFFASKLLYFLLTPIVWFVGIVIFAMCTKNKKRRKRILIISAVFFYVISNQFVINEVIRAWEIQTIHIDSITQQYEYGIVLGGFNSYDVQFDRVNFYASSDRLWQTLLLYHEGKIQKILISGGEGRIVKEGYTESEITKDFLCRIGIPEHDIYIESQSRNTYENARFTAEMLQGKADTCLLITSAMHMRRAYACFEKQGVHCKMFTADRKAGPTKFVFDYCFIPNMAAIETWRVFLREVVGYISYKIMGYI